MRRVLSLLAVTACLVLVPATAASAHAELLGTTPAAGARLDQPPAEVTLRFSEPVKPVPDGVRLLASSGRSVDTGAARAASSQVSLPVPADLPDGIYVVSWRVVSADSHPVAGSFSFSVGASSAAPQATSVAPSDSGVAAAYWLFRGLGYAALALLTGGLVFLLLCWRAGWSSARARRLVQIGWLGSVLAAVAVLLLQGPYVSGGSLGTLLSPGPLRTTVDTGYGQLVLVRLGLLVLAAGFLLWRPAALAALALPLTWAGAGHARAGPDVALAFVADTAHLLAMAAWLGGLAMLFYCVLPSRRGVPVREAAAVLPRFSRLAMAAISVLVATGLIQAWRELRDTDLADGSSYTRLLVFKVAAFGLLLCLGAGSRALVQYRYVRPAAVVSGAARVSPLSSRQAPRARTARKQRHAEQQRELAALGLLRKSVRLELAISAAVLGLTAALVSTSPGGHTHAESGYQGPFSTVLSLPGGGDVQVWVDPARPGRNDLVVNVRDASGTNRDVPEVRASLSDPALTAEPMKVPLTRTAKGRFTAETVTLPSTGSWRLQIWVRTSEVDEVPVVTQVPVS
jgi:copper transport protein